MTGKSLIQDLRDNGHSSFTQGLLQSLTFSATYRTSAEDNISAITGQPVGTSEKVSQGCGKVLGAGAAGAALGALAGIPAYGYRLCKGEAGGDEWCQTLPDR